MLSAKRLNFQMRYLPALVFACACSLPINRIFADDQTKAAPSKVQIPSEFADADAVILEWDQSWRVGEGKALVYHELKRVLIHNDRALGPFADPRITYHSDYDSVDVKVARTILPSGKVLEIPKYSLNEVSPSDATGWPAFAAIRQKILTYSGIESGAILELEYEKTTKPGMRQGVEMEVRVDADYPILVRRVTFPDGKAQEWKNLPAAINEPQSTLWRDQSNYAWYSDAVSPSAWAARIVEELEAAAQDKDAIKKVAKDWTQGKVDAVEKVAAIRDKVNALVTIVNFTRAWMPDRLRSADTVLAAHYGEPAECAALLLAVCRNAGLKADPFFVIREKGAGLVRSAISDFGVSVKDGGKTTYWSLAQGRIAEPGSWGGARRFDRSFLTSGKTTPPEFTSSEKNKLSIEGVVTVDDKASWSAKLTLQASGLFVPAEGLQTQTQKRNLVSGFIERLLPNSTLDDFSVTTLTDDTFAVSATAHSSKAADSIDGAFVMEMPKDGPWTKTFALPLARSDRRTAILLDGPFEESTRLEFKLPSGWTVAASPSEVSLNSAGDGKVSQTMVENDGTVVVERRTVIPQQIKVEAFAKLRDVLNTLQSRRGRTLIVSPKQTNVQRKDSASSDATVHVHDTAATAASTLR